MALLLSDAAGPWCSRESADFCPLSSPPESRLSLFSDFKNAFLSPLPLLDTHDYVIYGLRFLKRSEEPLISYVHAFSSVKIPKVRNYKGPSFLLETERREKTGRLGKLELKKIILTQVYTSPSKTFLSWDFCEDNKGIYV